MRIEGLSDRQTKIGKQRLDKLSKKLVKEEVREREGKRDGGT